ncbi:uncharacterized protein N7484_011021 [Penicillium longicatenatum]|uniref:uncharacterized protein n=1 Tax=Penicillium longicatenatum TaxID=1561947 RepID=UPI0025477F1A|nr:uncharacterized protein N7484_011021 [Penicillium longicatenatum]KAJ5630921.1 hypothetical protein N7484_011021 [Penicillium longicatenatum]
MLQFNGPFRIITTLGSRVILPASYTEWLKNCPGLDHQELVHDEYFAAYPGMEGQKVVTDPRKILIDVTKRKLNQNSSFAISAMHTTSELLKQALLDICMHPKLIPDIRYEASKAVEESGWSTAGVFKMRLLDSVVKETQRLKPGSLVNLERKALRGVVLPNGMTIPRGTNIAVDSSMMWDPAIYPDPFVYDGYRFLRLRESGNTGAALASSSPEHIAFGIGKPICPSRFFASNEVKIALAKILLTYDVRLPEGFKPKVFEMGYEMLSDLGAKLEIRKRSGL